MIPYDFIYKTQQTRFSLWAIVGHALSYRHNPSPRNRSWKFSLICQCLSFSVLQGAMVMRNFLHLYVTWKAIFRQWWSSFSTVPNKGKTHQVVLFVCLSVCVCVCFGERKGDSDRESNIHVTEKHPLASSGTPRLQVSLTRDQTRNLGMCPDGGRDSTLNNGDTSPGQDIPNFKISTAFSSKQVDIY